MYVLECCVQPCLLKASPLVTLLKKLCTLLILVVKSIHLFSGSGINPDKTALPCFFEYHLNM